MYICYSHNWVFLPIWTELGSTGICEDCQQMHSSVFQLRNVSDDDLVGWYIYTKERVIFDQGMCDFPADFQPDIRWFCPLRSSQNPEIKAHQSGEEHQVNYGVITIYCIVLSPWIQYIFTLGSGQSLEIKAN